MWVSKKKYNELLEKQNNLEQVCNGWKAKYEAVKEDKVTFIDGAVVISTEMLNELARPNIEMSKQLEDSKNELMKFRQLYADEVQKRLELIEMLGNAQAT